MKADPTMCQAKRCLRPAVENRLCAIHDADWLLNNHQPPMPDYGAPPPREVSNAELMEVEAMARESLRVSSSAPLDTPAQAQALADEAAIAKLGAETLRERVRDSIRPHLDAIRKIEQKHAKAIARFERAAAIAQQRLAHAPAQGAE